MVAIDNHKYFNIDFFTLKFDGHDSFSRNVKRYFGILKKLNEANISLQLYIEHFDFYLEIMKLDTVEKIDEILINLETISEILEKELEDSNVKKWYFYPIHYMFEKVEASNQSLQAMLGTQQAILMDKNDTTQNTEV